MKGFVEVRCSVSKDQKAGNVVTTYAIIPNLDTRWRSSKDLISMKIESSREMKFSRLQLIAARKNMSAHLEDKGGIRFEKCPAEFIYNKSKDYYAIFANIGTEDHPEYKSFYLNTDYRELLDFYKLEYEFTEVDDIADPEAPTDTDNN